MTKAEIEFLAMVTLGMFEVDHGGIIWRNKEWTKGSRSGSSPALVECRTRRADVSLSGRRHRGSTTYRRVMFVSRGRRWKVAAHRAVWLVLRKEPIPKGLEINHKNGKGEDNRPENLEIVTASENTTHSIRELGAPRKGKRGSENNQAKLNERQVAEIRKLARLRSMPQWKIADLFGVGQQTVSMIATGRIWKHVRA